MKRTPVAFSSRHQHTRCIKTALLQAEQLCRERGVRLTAVRRRVLELVWASHAPVKAYDLLKSLQQDQHNASPPTVYRALDFLSRQGLVHQLHSINAFTGCGFPEQPHSGQFFICEHCGVVSEANDPRVNRLLLLQAKEMGFSIGHNVLEISGTCPNCST